ncbi:MAG: hypothetical protein JO146_02215 [Candidatus Eremiobacteraeota bacterium]|nr:hypothetical protein [Candidatus Eremiobacteraeota bacterium]
MIRILIGSFALTLAVSGAALPAAAQEYPPPGALPPPSAATATAKPDPAMLGRARHFFDELQAGSVNRSELAPGGANASLNNATIANAQHMIGSLGLPMSFVQQQAGSQGGVSWAVYLVTFKNGQSLDFLYGVNSDGKVTTLGLGTPR